MKFYFRPVMAEEIDIAIKFALNVFMEFEAPGYSPEGIACFKSFILSDAFKKYYIVDNNLFLGSFYKYKLIGIVAMKNSSHVCLAFVEKEFHRKGIATKLFNLLFENRKANGMQEITLNSSPYAVPFYHAIGFIDTDIEHTQDGITYTPMVYYL